MMKAKIGSYLFTQKEITAFFDSNCQIDNILSFKFHKKQKEVIYSI